MEKKIVFPILLIVLLSLISYFNVFDNEFVWDDHVFILDNPDIRSYENIKLFFTQDVDGLYRPLRSLHYTFVYSMAGKNEFLYHFNSVFLHIIISILVFFIIFELFNKRTALLAALIFAAHPIHTARVTNITAGFDLLGIFLMLFSFYLYVKYSKLNLKKYFFFSLLFFIAALFASEEAATLPLLVVLYEFTFNREKFSKIKNYSPFFIIAIFYAFLRFFVLGIKGRMQEYLAGNLFFTLLTMLKVYIYYIYLLIVPINLTLFRDVSPVTNIFEPKVWLSAFLLMAIFFFTVKHHKNKILFFSVFWFFITLLPVSNISPLQTFMAERYLYVPSIAFSLLVSYLTLTIYNSLKNKKLKIGRVLAIVFIVLLLSFYVIATLNRNSEWKDNLTLWSRTVETSPNSSKAHDNLGFTYEQAGNDEKALEEFQKAVELQPDNFRALANLGVAYAKLGFFNKSVEALEASLKTKPYHKTYDKLGLVYAELGKEGLAVEMFSKAIKMEPRYAKAHNDLATAYGKLGKFDLALQEFNEAIRIDKDYADAHYNLGILHEFLGEDVLARKEFETAVRLEPKNELYAGKVTQ